MIVVSAHGFKPRAKSQESLGSDAYGSPSRHGSYSEEVLVLGTLTTGILAPLPEIAGL